MHSSVLKEAPAEAVPSAADAILCGTLHIYVAFDWGEEIDLDHARRLVPAEVQALPRRRRTPSSFAYRPPPLRFALAPVPLTLPEVGVVAAPAEATVFDFAAVSLDLEVPFQLSQARLTQLAGWLAAPADLLQTARHSLDLLYQKLLPAIQDPQWSDDLSEEYFVIHLPPGEPRPAAQWLTEHAGWLAGLLRLESGPLSADEIAEALRLRLQYRPDDLLITDWAAAVLIDSDCEETLQTIEFTNLQLLEFRHIDNRLDDNLKTAYGLIQRLTQSLLPFWRTHARRMRAVGELKAEANELFERTENVLKLVGDQYLARVYRQLASRFHLQDWEQSIQRKLEVIEGIYQVLSDQAATYRGELLEIIIVLLIIIEIGLALFWHR